MQAKVLYASKAFKHGPVSNGDERKKERKKKLAIYTYIRRASCRPVILEAHVMSTEVITGAVCWISYTIIDHS